MLKIVLDCDTHLKNVELPLPWYGNGSESKIEWAMEETCKTKEIDMELKWHYGTHIPEIKKVIFNPPATIVMWDDGTKTVVKCKPGEMYTEESGLAFCVMKKVYGDKFHSMFKKYCTGEHNDRDGMDDQKAEWFAKGLVAPDKEE